MNTNSLVFDFRASLFFFILTMAFVAILPSAILGELDPTRSGLAYLGAAVSAVAALRHATRAFRKFLVFLKEK